MKKRKIKIEYTFLLEFEHDKHFEEMKKELLKGDVCESFGAGVVDDKVYSYSKKRIVGSGRVVK